ncbi:DnaB-like helicase C-terminal domain-containing protein [Virgibacillus sp. 179-BFC.A HS]|uniref:DnaB-like helicase C-terminal domain-containing protein n=1 Tax=Tigheibacillus jepli TaxID=3035914 RepID=A0ABU5CD08_9BACI|nr:DnaB-like helicase C-terminal domain-containing protein [Virgibacillus sp. 179-BFC.A HS]MDY0404220.1 DnaB-like helicase C-terminal domain-containing protein [Virgibacillus sp. 179-BFC.A HS]
MAARPSVGKTAFALNLAGNHAKNGGSSLIFSLEMTAKSLLQRMISAQGWINSQKWRNMLFAKEDYERAIQAIGEISNWQLHMHDKLRTVTDISVAIRKIKDLQPNDRHLVIIDYLQLLHPVSKRERRDLEVGDMTRELKQLAVELNIPIVLLSQLSRGVESRENKRPFMSDLRESGNIEQDADMIAFLYRDDYYRKDQQDAAPMEIIIGKQRNGPTGTVRLSFQKEFGRFVEENV